MTVRPQFYSDKAAAAIQASRELYPDRKDLSDQQIIEHVREKHYTHLTQEDFNQKIEFISEQAKLKFEATLKEGLGPQYEPEVPAKQLSQRFATNG